ncbi:phosphoethanolamine transferase [Brumicola nitratireducens]|uniref:Putative sulfatase n=1 Tax=Glaciecola nitratireducens (strain JCM 12485 / KCTC 12276 / FR1064) TaxID=1085623 RepID=G4QFW1_GLANF|nr:phosphoethanolamine--lipid A transferase [Glaciecola nitratireducens]AEP29052.1 putative sulfatase [Glaciecola nitratireducens FR1064]
MITNDKPITHFIKQSAISLVNRIRNHRYSANQLIVITSLYVAFVCNFPFLTRAITAITQTSDYSFLFLLSVPTLLVSLIIMINGTIGVGKLLKPLLILTILLSTVLLYATASYGVVFDYTMIQNGAETDSAEAFSYLNAHDIVFVILVGGIPALGIFFAKVKTQSWSRGLKARSALVASHTILVVLIASVFYANYAAVGRNNRELLAYITPYKFVDATVKYTKRHYFTTELPFKTLDSNPLLEIEDDKARVTVLVVGETARAQNFSLNGYSHNTNQYTEDSGIVSFTKVSSCGTATAVSLPCMFSRLDRQTYDNRTANAQQNLLDIAKAAGTDVLWIDNNNGSCKGVCARVNSIDIDTGIANPLCDGEYCFDEALLLPLQNKLDNLSAKNTLIVLHMIGSHGPTYYKRYPQDKAVFLPDCQRSDIQHCSEQEIVNTYDNTIAYTDFVLNKIIARLEKLESDSAVQTAMLYISDHGESLGEKGVYLHGLPYAFAPQEQTHVPMLFWQNKSLAHQDNDCIKSVSSEVISHDNLFDIVLGITSVSSTQYIEGRDVLSKCRASDGLLAAATEPNTKILL